MAIEVGTFIKIKPSWPEYDSAKEYMSVTKLHEIDEISGDEFSILDNDGDAWWLNRDDFTVPREQPPSEAKKKEEPETPKREIKSGDTVRIKPHVVKTLGTRWGFDAQATYTVKNINQYGHRVIWSPKLGQDCTFNDDDLIIVSSFIPKEEAKKSKEIPATNPKGFTDRMGELLESIDQEVGQRIDSAIDKEMQELRDMAKKNQKLEVKIGDKTNIVTGARHKQLEDLINTSSLRLNTLLVGMAGTGKTHAAQQAAEALGVPFFSMSVGAQTSKSDIIGYMSATGTYVGTHFRDAYENGGVFLMDEIDAGNANVLIQVNAALSNGSCAFPDTMVPKHKDFIFIASANTYGNGANRQYVGRNQLDAATLDRFTILDWLIDDELELGFAIGKDGEKWYKAVKAAREYVAAHNIRALITPRATQKGSILLEHGYSIKTVIDAVLLGSVPEDQKIKVAEEAVKAFK